MDFFFDNIVFFAVVAYMLIVFVSKVAMTGGGGGESPPRRPRGHSAHDFPRSATRPTPRAVPAHRPPENIEFETEFPDADSEISDAQKRREIANDARNNAEPQHSPTAPCNQYAPEPDQAIPTAPQEAQDLGEMPDFDAARRLVEQMTADSHGFHGGNSYINADLFEMENFAEEDAEIPQKEHAEISPEPEASQAAALVGQTPTAAEKYGLDSAGALRRAFVAAEILGKPKSLKSDETW